MNTNINRYKSPTPRQSPPMVKTLNTLQFVPYSPRIGKNDALSSAEESTKQEPSSRHNKNFEKQIEVFSPTNLAFNKVKKQQTHQNKIQINNNWLKTHNSEKCFNYRVDTKYDTKGKKSPEKCSDYYGFKSPAKETKQKSKVDQKLSDSAGSDTSQNSNHSNNNQGKYFKFCSKKLQKKQPEQELIKLQKIQKTKEKQLIQKYIQPFIQDKIEQTRKAHVVHKNNQIDFHNVRRQSPSNRIFPSPSKNQDSNINNTHTQHNINYPNHNQNTNNIVDNGVFKRSSLTPQNKFQLNRQISHENFTNIVKANTMSKNVPATQRNFEKNQSPTKFFHQEAAQKVNKNHFYPHQNKQKKQTSEFSFSKEKSQYMTQNLSKKHTIKSPLYLPIITILPFTLELPHEPSSQPISFIILEKLAENKASSILKVLHPQSCAVYCLKKSGVDKNNVDQLIIEHKVSTSLIHPNLVRAYASFYDKQNIYLLMQFMEGKSLNKRNRKITKKIQQNNQESLSSAYINSKTNIDIKLNRQSFNVNERPRIFEEAHGLEPYRFSNLHNLQIQKNLVKKQDKFHNIKSILEQILEGLLCLHDNNIMHRDLKPDNIFVSHNNYKIGDFGSCTYKNTQQYIGTLDYAAPEIMLRQNYDRSIDLWSLGCIAYELDVGEPPFYHRDRKQTIRRIINVQYDDKLISDLNLKKLIGKLLLKSGHLRIDVNEALMQVKMLQPNPLPSPIFYKQKF